MRIWKYTTTGQGKVKHLFTGKDEVIPVCATIGAYSAVWQTDRKGLKERRECKNCEIREYKRYFKANPE